MSGGSWVQSPVWPSFLFNKSNYPYHAVMAGAFQWEKFPYACKWPRRDTPWLKKTHVVPCILNTPIIVTSMLPAAWFIVLIFSLASTVTGNTVRVNRSPITLPLAKRINSTSIPNLVQHDQTRTKLLRVLLVILFPISLYWCTDGINVCYYLHHRIFNPESEYSTPQLLTSDSRYS